MSQTMKTLNGYEIVDNYARTQITAEKAALKQEIATERKRIDALASLPEGSTAGDAELVDAHIDYTGKNWESTGAHIRGVTSQLSKQIDDLGFTQGNLFNKETVTQNKILENDGSVSDLDNYAISDYIRVKANKTYCVSVSFSSAGCLYDEKKQYVSPLYEGGTNGTFATFTPTVDGYARVNMYVNSSKRPSGTIENLIVSEGEELKPYPPYNVLNNPKLEISKEQVTDFDDTKLSGKKLLFIGDSITDMGTFVEPLVKMIKPSAYYNRGVSGNTLVPIGTGTSIVERAQLESSNETSHTLGFPTEVDYIFILCGVNDWGKSFKTDELLGDVKEGVNTNTFCGCYHWLINNLQNRYPNAEIIIINNYRVYSPTLFPNFREVEYVDGNENNSFTYRINHEGKTFDDYRETTKTIATMYGLPIIDLLECGFSFWKEKDRIKYSYYQADENGKLVPDGLHLSENGGEKVAEFIYSKLK